MTDLMRSSEADDRFRALLMSTFAVLATLLAAVGIFDVTARAVAARSREIGIRTALGARVDGLIRLVGGTVWSVHSPARPPDSSAHIRPRA